MSDAYLPALRGGSSLAGRLPRGIARLTDDEHFDGAIRAARVEAVGEVAAEAMRQLSRLVDAEEEIRRMHPLATARAELLVNTFTQVVASEIADMRRPL